MSQNNNLELWQAIGKTDPKYTKEATIKGGFTSVSAYYQIEKATEKWGPYGKNWGLRAIKVDYSLMDATGLATMSAEFFSPVSKFNINNAISVNSNGYVDSDFMKKLQTNTLTKALSMLGMSNDVFKGQFDDHDYVEERKAEVELETAEDKEKLNSDRFAEVKELLEQSINGLEALPTVGTVGNYGNKMLSQIQRKLKAYGFNPSLYDEKLAKAVGERIEQIKAKQES